MRAMWVLLVLLAAPAGAAQALLAIPDGTGDVQVDYPPTGTGYTGPVADGVDLVSAALGVAAENLTVSFTVKDLGALDQTAEGIQADTMLYMEWTQADGSRPGRWEARADYQPASPRPWSFWAEGPCLTYQPNGGCPGSDRDIHDGLAGQVDPSTNTVHLFLPFELLGTLSAETTWDQFVARTDAVWPSYPMYIGDTAQDLTAAVLHPGTFAPASASSANATQPSPASTPTTHSSSTTTGSGASSSAPVAPARGSPHSAAPSGNGASPGRSATAKSSPSLGLIVTLTAIGFLAVRRR